ncbi:SDR family oxidoreductase [Rhizomonospora bruguierae]|uniref:SDR family oxidoreductase n=1 Tax=Rhizomonospora bruguierae TaxID=1581705 RepID=UPI0020C12DDD|nr:NAD-dependent epimerase/dehydratase family protein [Micromonospora sp. NBRC 107566]
MRIFLAGATGVIGSRLTPLLLRAGHEVAAMTRTPAKAAGLAATGAHPVVCDVYDAEAVRSAVVAFRPDVLIHQLTDLPDKAADLPARREANARMRREGTDSLLAAARAAGAARVLAQSVAWELAGEGGAAKEYLEHRVLDAGGVVLRYGQFYGPGTYHERRPPEPPRIQVDEAARRTVDALDSPTGILTIADE